MANGFDWKAAAVGAAFTVVASSIGMGIEYIIQAKEKKTEYFIEVQKELFGKTADNYENMRAAYEDLCDQLTSKQGLRPTEIDTLLEKWKVLDKAYAKHARDIERNGTSEEIKAVRKLREFTGGITEGLRSLKILSRNVESNIVLMILSNGGDKPQELMSRSLKEYMNRENEFYFFLIHQKPALEAMEKSLNLAFHEEFGVEEAEENKVIIENGKGKQVATYVPNEYPFVIASSRTLYVYSGTLSSHLKDMDDRDKKFEQKMKYLFMNEVHEDMQKRRSLSVDQNESKPQVYSNVSI